MAHRRSPRSRAARDEYADYGYARAPRRRTNVSAIVIGIVLAISAIAVLVNFLASDRGLSADDRDAAIEVARRAVIAALTRDMPNFQRTIDPMYPDGLTADMSKQDLFRMKNGHAYQQEPTPEDREWITRQWDTYLNALRKTAEHDLGVKTAQDVNAVFRNAKIDERGALDRVDVRVVAEHGTELTIFVGRSGDGWRVGRWETEGTYYGYR